MTRALAFALLAALPFAAYALPGHADATMSIGNPIGVGGYTVRGPSTVTIAPTDRPGALAEITFNNVSVNGAQDTGTTGMIDLDGIEVGASFEWETDPLGSDTITLTPPDGIICVPSCVMQVPEDSTATVILYSHEAVGM
jgi:hypothetical protein